MTLTEAIGRLVPSRAADVHEALLRFAESNGLRRQAVDNLNNETRLAEDAWRDALSAILAAGTPNELHMQLVLSFRAHLLRADAIRVSGPRLGRAITTRRYAGMLAERLGVTEGEAQRHVTRLVASGTASTLNGSPFWTPWRDGRTAWATFDAADCHVPPFDGCGSADEIRGVLGLDPTERGEPILLFEYQLPATVTAQFPTVAEAYAAEGWQVFFRPAPAEATAGLTMTWHDYAESPPRPETVHRGFEGGTFLTPLREIL